MQNISCPEWGGLQSGKFYQTNGNTSRKKSRLGGLRSREQAHVCVPAKGHAVTTTKGLRLRGSPEDGQAGPRPQGVR